MKFSEVLSTFFRYLYSAYCIVKVQWYVRKMPVQRVTVFGSSLVHESDVLISQAHALGRLLVQKGYGVITGGGPGFMVAVNQGAYEAALHLGKENRSLGIAVKGIDEHFHNPYGHMMKVDTFLVRKELLISLSQTFIVLPGGIGTMDELFDLLNRCKHGMKKRCRTILIGTAYWAPIVEWFEMAEQREYIAKKHRNYFTIVDSLDAVMDELNE